MSPAYARKLLERVGVEEREIARIVSIGSIRTNDVRQARRVIDMDRYHLIANWQCFAILSLAETEDFGGTVDDVALRLGLTKKSAKTSVDRLLRLGLLARDARHRLKPTGEQYTTSDELVSRWIKESHLQTLDLAATALRTVPIDERDFVSATMTLDAAALSSLKAVTRQFLEAATAVAESTPKREVYRLAVQLFPLSTRRPEC